MPIEGSLTRAVGTDVDRFQPVLSLFAEQCARGAFPGGQLVVIREGRVVCDATVGVARGFRGNRDERVCVGPATRFQVMSASKPFVGFAVALLDDAGMVDVTAPVATYFPEFADHGKAAITVLDVLLHRSGVLFEELSNRPDAWSDPEAVATALADARPRYPRGTLAYSPAGFGWVMAEVVRRVSGQSLQEFLLSHLPPELRGIRFVDASQSGSAAESYWLGPPRFVVGGRDIAGDFEQVNNHVTCFRAAVPGAGLLASARELALFYDLLVAGGRGVVSGDTLRRYVTEQTAGVERQMRVPFRLGRGFALGSSGPHPYGWWNTRHCFGHAGGFGVVAYADPRRASAVAITTNGHRGVGDLLRRFAPLGSRIRRAVRALA